MLLAQLDDEVVEATLSGPRRATCPGCEDPVIAKTGETVAWHWAHTSRMDCDPWHSSETEWHLGWKRDAREHGARLEVPMWGPDGTRHRADIVLPNGIVVEVQHSSLKPSELREREAFYAGHGGIRWVFDHESFRWMFDPRDRSRGAYGMEPEPWLLDWFGGSMENCWGQYGAPRPMLASVQAPMVWDIREGDLATGTPQWATRPVQVDSWGGEWIVRLSDATDVFESDDALRAVDGVVNASPVPVEVPCPACGEHHHPDRGRLDRRSGTWQPCWDMTGALWALLKDKAVSQRSKSWARGFLGLDDLKPREADQ